MLAPEQPIENKDYAYDEDIVSDDGRIWLDFVINIHYRHIIYRWEISIL